MKRMTTILLVLMMVLPTTISYSASITSESETIDIGKVIEVIDGEVLKVFFFRRDFSQPAIEMVRVIGLDTEASTEAFQYASSRLLGKTVFFVYDNQVGTDPDGLTLAHVFIDYDSSYAEEILSLGFGLVDQEHEDNSYHQDLMSAEYSAELYEIGRWETSQSRTTDRININRAPSSLLMEVLGVTKNQAAAIVTYRQHNLYNDIFEVMAADSNLDREWFDQHSHLMSVITNINKTSYLELYSLLNPSVHRELFMDDLDYYLKFNEVTSLDQLNDITTFSKYLTTLEPYLTLDTTNVLIEEDKKVANVNTVGEDSFILVTGLTEYDYKNLLTLRGSDTYVITSLAELYKDNEVYNKGTAYIYSDHLTTLTDVNKAEVFELKTVLEATDLSLYERQTLAEQIVSARPFYSEVSFKALVGSSVYDQIEAYVYVNASAILERYNPNTAETADITGLDLKYKGRTTNYTNVNTATKGMLLDLNEDMTILLVKDLMTYRSRYPFRDNDDLRQIFDDHDQLALYTKIAKYLCYE